MPDRQEKISKIPIYTLQIYQGNSTRQMCVIIMFSFVFDTNFNESLCYRTVTEDQLEELFGKFGRIVQKNILKDKITGLPRGVAFVRYVRLKYSSSFLFDYLV